MFCIVCYTKHYATHFCLLGATQTTVQRDRLSSPCLKQLYCLIRVSVSKPHTSELNYVFFMIYVCVRVYIIFNERKITPLALSCNHGDDDVVSTCTNTGRHATQGDILVVSYDLWRWIMVDHRNTHCDHFLYMRKTQSELPMGSTIQ